MKPLQRALLNTLKLLGVIAGLSILITAVLALPMAPAAFRVSHTLEIDAPPEMVWAVFANFDEYGEWNANIPQISGEMRAGAVLDMQLVEPPKYEARDYRPTVTIALPGRHLAWKKSLYGIAFFEHHFEIEALDNGRTRFHQYEDFSGLLSWILKFKPQHPIHSNPAKSFRKMNEALRDRVAKGAFQSP